MRSLKTAVLFIIFNRIDVTAKVFESLKAARPQRLYIAGDGPRKNVPGDEESCNEARSIVTKVDWDCKVYTLFNEKNQGSKYGIIAAIDWFFSQEEEGIILEHDCLPSDFFFEFCSTLLHYYRNDPRVMHIAGSNLQFGIKRGNASYYFSRIASSWGWASWRRVWQSTNREMIAFPQFEKEGQMMNIVSDRRIANWLISMLKKVYEGTITTWDFPHGYSIACNNGLCITPNENLISNIGFGEGATHTTDATDVHADIPLGKITEISHPRFFIPDSEADIYQLSLTADNVKQKDIKK